jgi:glycerol-3-phosphate dehydrogenase
MIGSGIIGESFVFYFLIFRRPVEVTMISKADVVVVGSGGLGAATAYYLAKRGISVALLDKHDIGSQTFQVANKIW